MLYFSGEYECRLDEKGRLTLPSRFKSFLPELPEESEQQHRLVLRRGFEPCLTLYTPAEWEVIFHKVVALNEFNEEQRMFQRTFLRGCTEIELDKSGRFLIPKLMLKYAQLDKESILVGVGNRIEIWNPELYEKYMLNNAAEFSLLAERFLGAESRKEENGMVVNIHQHTEAQAAQNNTAIASGE